MRGLEIGQEITIGIMMYTDMQIKEELLNLEIIRGILSTVEKTGLKTESSGKDHILILIVLLHVVRRAHLLRHVHQTIPIPDRIHHEIIVNLNDLIPPFKFHLQDQQPEDEMPLILDLELAKR